MQSTSLALVRRLERTAVGRPARRRARRRAMEAHPAGRGAGRASRRPETIAAPSSGVSHVPSSRTIDPPVRPGLTAPTDSHDPAAADAAAAEEGSLVTEYGLLAVVAATIAGVVIKWASSGALVTLFNALLQQARLLVGA